MLEQIRTDPARMFELAGLTADPWQQAVLNSVADQIALLCTRQCGKTTVSCFVALKTVLLCPRSLVLCLSPSERQSTEFVLRCREYLDLLGWPVRVVKDSALQLHFANSSRLIGLPENERTIRTYAGVKLLVIDEAARVDDSLYSAVTPMLAVSHGRLLVLSTPFGKLGWFHALWEAEQKARALGSTTGWETYCVTAAQCPRFTPEFLERERRRKSVREFQRKYYCEFCEAEDAAFRHEDIARAFEQGGTAWKLE